LERLFEKLAGAIDCDTRRIPTSWFAAPRQRPRRRQRADATCSAAAAGPSASPGRADPKLLLAGWPSRVERARSASRQVCTKKPLATRAAAFFRQPARRRTARLGSAQIRCSVSPMTTCHAVPRRSRSQLRLQKVATDWSTSSINVADKILKQALATRSIMSKMSPNPKHGVPQYVVNGWSLNSLAQSRKTVTVIYV